jgi:hypothetical protein
LGALARSASGEILEFLAKTAKIFLENENFHSAGAAHLARFWRNTEFMNDLPGLTQCDLRVAEARKCGVKLGPSLCRRFHRID